MSDVVTIKVYENTAEGMLAAVTAAEARLDQKIDDALLDSQVISGVTTSSVVPATGNIHAIGIGPGTYPNWGGMIIPAENIGTLQRVDGGFSVSLTPIDLSGKVNVTDVINDLNSLETNKPGSANNDRLLDEKKANKTQLNSKADLIVGKNLINKTTFTLGQYIAMSGAVTADAGQNSSDFIEVEPSQQYTCNEDIRFLTYYDADKVPLNLGSNAAIKTFTTSSGCYFVKLTFVSANFLLDLQLEKGAVSTTFVPYQKSIPENQIALKEYAKKTDLIPYAFTYDVLNKADLIVGKNLINKTTFTLGQYIAMSGAVTADAGQNSSDFIEVEPSQQYTCNEDIRFLTYYDADKVPLNLGSNAAIKTFTTSSGCYFVKLTFVSANFLLDLQLEKGAISTFFQAYKKSVPYNQLPDLGAIYTPDIIVPSEIYLTETLQSNIYFDNVVVPQYGENLDKYRIDIDSAKGSQFNRFWRHNAVEGEAGTYNLSLNVKQNRNIITAKNTVLKIAAKASGTGVTRKVLLIGDSTVDYSAISTPLKAFFDADAMDVQFVGTRGVAGLKHEGRSGWTLNDYNTQASIGGIANAFWNSSTSLFDFQKYLTDSSQTIAANDWVIIQLGINDMFGQTEIASAEAKAIEVMTQLNTVMNNIQAVVPNIRIGIALTIPPADNQDGFGVSYGNAYNMELYKKTGNVIWNKKVLEILDNPANKTAKRYVLSGNCNIDTVNNFPKTVVTVNSRSSITELQQINGVHPDSTGYAQIADSYIGIIKYFL